MDNKTAWILMLTLKLVCLSRDAPCVPQALESLRCHPTISYIWLNLLTFNPVTILEKENIKNPQNISLLTPITNLTPRNIKSI